LSFRRQETRDRTGAADTRTEGEVGVEVEYPQQSCGAPGTFSDLRYPIKNSIIFIKPIEVIGITGIGGSSSALSSTEYLGNQVTIYAIAAGDARPGEQILRVFFGSQ
jgi:hypothetical protein